MVPFTEGKDNELYFWFRFLEHIFYRCVQFAMNTAQSAHYQPVQCTDSSK
uniref:Uncharacterized protein n=1 Tax=Anguilla anguilla TaxID=7936 RepID=A0A0E9WE12_ANGAN